VTKAGYLTKFPFLADNFCIILIFPYNNKFVSPCFIHLFINLFLICLIFLYSLKAYSHLVSCIILFFTAPLLSKLNPAQAVANLDGESVVYKPFPSFELIIIYLFSGQVKSYLKKCKKSINVAILMMMLTVCSLFIT
jgi:hypothetical protein